MFRGIIFFFTANNFYLNPKTKTGSLIDLIEAKHTQRHNSPGGRTRVVSSQLASVRWEGRDVDVSLTDHIVAATMDGR